MRPPVATGRMGQVSATLADPLTVLATDAAGNPVPDVTVSWSVVSGGGSVTPSSTTNSSGVATAVFTLGATLGEQTAQAQASGLTPVVFTATAVAAGTGLSVVGGGDNVPERFSSDLWVHGNYAYTGTWGFREEEGNTLKVWSLGAGGAPTLVGSVTVPDIGTVSDVQVSDDGQLLVLSGEAGLDGGIYLYSLSNPAAPSFLELRPGRRGRGPYRHPLRHQWPAIRLRGTQSRFPGGAGDDPALLIYDVTDPEAPTLVATERFPERTTASMTPSFATVSPSPSSGMIPASSSTMWVTVSVAARRPRRSRSAG